jgi:hypothetical protein
MYQVNMDVNLFVNQVTIQNINEKVITNTHLKYMKKDIKTNIKIIKFVGLIKGEIINLENIILETIKENITIIIIEKNYGERDLTLGKTLHTKNTIENKKIVQEERKHVNVGYVMKKDIMLIHVQ